MGNESNAPLPSRRAPGRQQGPPAPQATRRGRSRSRSGTHSDSRRTRARAAAGGRGAGRCHAEGSYHRASDSELRATSCEYRAGNGWSCASKTKTPARKPATARRRRFLRHWPGCRTGRQVPAMARGHRPRSHRQHHCPGSTPTPTRTRRRSQPSGTWFRTARQNATPLQSLARIRLRRQRTGWRASTAAPVSRRLTTTGWHCAGTGRSREDPGLPQTGTGQPWDAWQRPPRPPSARQAADAGQHR